MSSITGGSQGGGGGSGSLRIRLNFKPKAPAPSPGAVGAPPPAPTAMPPPVQRTPSVPLETSASGRIKRTASAGVAVLTAAEGGFSEPIKREPEVSEPCGRGLRRRASSKKVVDDFVDPDEALLKMEYGPEEDVDEEPKPKAERAPRVSRPKAKRRQIYDEDEEGDFVMDPDDEDFDEELPLDDDDDDFIEDEEGDFDTWEVGVVADNSKSDMTSGLGTDWQCLTYCMQLVPALACSSSKAVWHTLLCTAAHTLLRFDCCCTQAKSSRSSGKRAAARAPTSRPPRARKAPAAPAAAAAVAAAEAGSAEPSLGTRSRRAKAAVGVAQSSSYVSYQTDDFSEETSWGDEAHGEVRYNNIWLKECTGVLKTIILLARKYK